MKPSVKNAQISISYKIILALKVVIKAIMLLKKVVNHAHKIVMNVTTKDYVKNVNLIFICFKIYVYTNVLHITKILKENVKIALKVVYLAKMANVKHVIKLFHFIKDNV